jgi:hypothetical protein
LAQKSRGRAIFLFFIFRAFLVQPLLLICRKKILKVPKCEIFDPFFFTPINPIWVSDEDWRKKNFCLKTTADIRHFVFFTQAECALKKCLRRLSLS